MATTPLRRARVGVAAATAAAVLWGCGTVATASVLDHGVSAPVFTVVELGSSVLFLAVVAGISHTPLPDLRRWWKVGALGLLEPGLTYLLMNAGLARTSVTHAALIGAAEPVLIAVLAWVVLRTPVPKRLFLPMFTVVVGSVLVVTAHGSSGGATVGGDLLVVAGILCASAYVVGSSRVNVELAAVGVVLFQQLFAFSLVVVLVAGAVAVGPGSGGISIDGSSVSWALLWVPLIGIGSSGLTFWLYLVALRHLVAGAAAQFLAIVPVVGFVGAVTLLGESITVAAAVGAGVVVISLVVIAHGERQAELEGHGHPLPV